MEGSAPAMTDENDIPGGVVHGLPEDFRDALKGDPEARSTWHDITPLARNEWICWIESAKKQETRRKRIDWGRSNLREGMRRPCCWPGCPHR
jgi:uncharacterized protein YdeI (YjbR/CyaY-like superfamily)